MVVESVGEEEEMVETNELGISVMAFGCGCLVGWIVYRLMTRRVVVVY